LQNFIKNNLCKVSRRRARDRDQHPSWPRRDRDETWDLRDRDSKKRVSRPVSRLRPSLETPSLVGITVLLRVAIMSPEKGLDQWKPRKTGKFDDTIRLN